MSNKERCFKRLHVFLLVVGALLLFLAGRAEGVRHAMCDSTYFIVDASYLDGVYVIDDTCYEPGELPSDSDFRIWTFLDGQAYENFGFIG